jgi:aryl-alcohol dehydrogenase-like predicted oxidoreductase
VLEFGIGSSFVSKRTDSFRKLFLLTARGIGIHTIDTAQQYGPAEEVIGRLLPTGYQVITKIGLSREVTKATPSDTRWSTHYSPSRLEEEINNSLQRLKRGKVFALLLHSITNDYDFSHHIETLNKLKLEGKVEKIGFSVDKGDILSNKSSWADVIEVHVSLLKTLVPVEGQTILVHGVYRDGQEQLLKEFLLDYPEIRVIVLLGTKKIRRLFLSVIKSKTKLRR